MIKKHVLFILASLLLVGSIVLGSLKSNESVVIINWMHRVGETDEVKAIEINGNKWINVNELCNLLGINYTTVSSNNRLKLELSTQSVIFTKGSPFVWVDDKIQQMAVAVKPELDDFYLLTESFVGIIGKNYSGDMMFDPQSNQLMVTPPRFAINGVRIFTSRNETQVVVVTPYQLEFTEEVSKDKRLVKLRFPSGSLNREAIENTLIKGLVESIKVEDSEKQSVLEFRTIEDGYFEKVVVKNDPHSLIVIFNTTKPNSLDEKTIQRLTEEKTQWSYDVIVVDPGHGGKDPGAVGDNKHYEKMVTLSVGLKLKRELEKLGFKVIMTRDKDVFIALDERGRIANKANGKLFVSLHCNSAKDKRAHGMETYFLSPTRTERAMAVAMRENEVIKFEEHNKQYQDLTEENFIFLSMAQAGFLQDSEELARLVQENVSNAVKIKNRGVDQAGFYVLYGASMPAILFEMGFISNKDEMKLLFDQKFQQKLASELAASIKQFTTSRQH